MKALRLATSVNSIVLLRSVMVVLMYKIAGLIKVKRHMCACYA
jgi:hypothetical protein